MIVISCFPSLQTGSRQTSQHDLQGYAASVQPLFKASDSRICDDTMSVSKLNLLEWGARITEVKTNALDDATADGRGKLLATAMVQQFEKTFPELLTAAGTEVQIIETDGF